MSGIIPRMLKRGGVAAGALALLGEDGRTALKGGAAVAVSSELIDWITGEGRCACSSLSPREWFEAVTAQAVDLVPDLIARDQIAAPLGDRGPVLAAMLLTHAAGAPQGEQAIGWFGARGVDRFDLMRAAERVREALEAALRARAQKAVT